jgi:hypothetical protein
MSFKVCIIEPNISLNIPYKYLSNLWAINWYPCPEMALAKFKKEKPDLVFFSASFTPEESVWFLDQLKDFFKEKIIPLVITVDFSNPVNFVPGTFWGEKIAVLDSLTSAKEFRLVLDRLLP